MYLVAIAWIYVVLMMAVAEVVSSQGTVLGGIITFLLYGVFPLSIVMYLMGTPMRRRARQAAEAEADARGQAKDGAPAGSEPLDAPQPAAATQAAAAPAAPTALPSSPSPDGSGHASSGPAPGLLTPERKEV